MIRNVYFYNYTPLSVTFKIISDSKKLILLNYDNIILHYQIIQINVTIQKLL